MDNVKVSVEAKEFEKALREYLLASKKDVGFALNKKAGDVAFSASKNMPGAVEVKATIRTDYPRDNPLWHALATGKTSRGASKVGTAVRGKGNNKIASAIYNSRSRAAGFSRTIFLRIARDFGKKVSGLRTSQIENTKVKKSGTKGDSDFMDAIFEVLGVSKDRGHDSRMDEAIRDALADQAADMRKYIEAKIAKRAKAHSGRKR
jgi:hypothetical protein